MEWFGLEGTFKGHLVQPPAASRAVFGLMRLLRAPSNRTVNVCRDGGSTTSLGNLCQCFTTLMVKNVFLLSSMNLASFSYRTITPCSIATAFTMARHTSPGSGAAGKGCRLERPVLSPSPLFRDPCWCPEDLTVQFHISTDPLGWSLPDHGVCRRLEQLDQGAAGTMLVATKTWDVSSAVMRLSWVCTHVCIQFNMYNLHFGNSAGYDSSANYSVVESELHWESLCYFFSVCSGRRGGHLAIQE